LSGTALPVANGGTGQTTASAAFNALSPVTTAGDLILGNGTNSSTRLGIGANGYVLTSNGTTAAWSASTGGVTSFSAGSTGLTPATSTTGAVTLAGTLAIANGGTGTATPSIVAGTNITVTGTWPNQTIASSGGSSLPSQTGNSGKFLKTDGTTASWNVLPTILNVLNRASATISIAVGNGVLAVLNRSGSTINVSVS